MLVTDAPDRPASPDGRCHVLEYASKRQRRVQRSTYSAELNGVIDTVETGILIQIAFHQILYGCDDSPTTMARMLEEGRLQPPLDCVCDARAVFDSIAASDVCDPAECSLKLHLLSIRDKILVGIIKRFFWADTRDMIADCLTKGGVGRRIMSRALEMGLFILAHDVLVCSRS